MSDRDTFAAAALPLCTRNGRNAEEISKSAYKLADAMLRERARNGSVEGCETVQSDHIPDAGKMVETPGEIDKYRRFIGEVMNWISEATVFLHDDVLRTDDARDVITDACSKCWGAFDRIAYPSTNHDAVPEAKADLPDERPPNAVSANGGTPGAASRDGSGTGNTPSDAEIDALEFVVYAGGIANGWDKDILRQWLIRLRPEFDSAEAIKEGDSDRSQPIGSPAKTNPTQPRNGTPVEGSVPGEGSVPDSRSENEPVAWAVMQNDWYHDAHLDYYKAVKLATAANVAGAKNPWNVVPLYRHPPCQDLSQKNLTDEEHDALEFAVETGRVATHDEAILRKLLERLGGGDG